jgi:GNAT superfamily N-acetyltransferase
MGEKGVGMATDTKVRPATVAELPAITESMARAFYDDPIFSWFLPDDRSRPKVLRRVFDMFGRKMYFPKGEMYTVDGNQAAAMWAPPDKWKTPMGQQIGLLPTMFRAVGFKLPKMLRVLTAMEKKHPEELHYYLAVLGTDPSVQGKGLGSALLEQTLQRCDEEGLPAYLESSSMGSRALYFRHGFKEIEELTFQDSPPFWLMWREPQGR